MVERCPGRGRLPEPARRPGPDDRRLRRRRDRGRDPRRDRPVAADAAPRRPPTRCWSTSLRIQAVARQRAFLRRAIEDAYDALDRQHERLRSFRNIILLLALCIAVLIGDHHRRACATNPDDHAAVLRRGRHRHRTAIRCSTARPARTSAQPQRRRHRRGLAARPARWRARRSHVDPEPARHLDAVRRAGGAGAAEGAARRVHRRPRPGRDPGRLRPRPVRAGLPAADPGVRAGARIRPAGVHLLAGPQGADAAQRAAGQGRLDGTSRRRRSIVAARRRDCRR